MPDHTLLDWASSNVVEARFVTEDTDRPYWRVTTSSSGDHFNLIGLGDTLRAALEDARLRQQRLCGLVMARVEIPRKDSHPAQIIAFKNERAP